MRQLYKVTFPVHIMPYKLDQLLLRDKVISGKTLLFPRRNFKFSDNVRRWSGVAVGVGSPRRGGQPGRGDGRPALQGESAPRTRNRQVRADGHGSRGSRAPAVAEDVAARTLAAGRAAMARRVAELNSALATVKHKTSVSGEGLVSVGEVTITVTNITGVARSLFSPSLMQLGGAGGGVLLLSRPHLGYQLITDCS